MVNNFDETALLQAKAMAETPAGKELINLLQNMDQSTITSAMTQASSGDYSQLANTLAPLLNSKDVQELFRKMEGK